MKKRKWLLALGLMASFAVLLAGCKAATGEGGGKDGGTVQKENAAQDQGAGTVDIVFWHSMGATQGQTIEGLVKTFNETVGKEKGINVSTVYQGKNTELSKKFKAAVQAQDMKSLPDLTMMSSGETGYMRSLELAIKGEDILNNGSIGLSKDDFQAGMINSLSYQGKVIGLPYAPSCILMYYNKDAFKEAGLDPENPPQTIEELGECSAKLTKKDGDQIVQYGFGHAADSWTMSSWIGQQNTDGKGYSLFGDNNNGHDDPMTKVVFDENGTMKHFLEIYSKAAKTGNFKYKEDDPTNNFTSGNVTIILASCGGLPKMIEAIGNNFELGVAMIPKVDEDATGGVSFGGSALYAIDKKNEDKLNATYELMKFLYAEDNQMTWHKGGGYLPSINAVYASDQYKKFIEEKPLFRVAKECVEGSNPNVQEPMCGVGGTILTVVKDGIIQALDESITIDEAVESMAQQCNDALTEYNEAN